MKYNRTQKLGSLFFLFAKRRRALVVTALLWGGLLLLMLPSLAVAGKYMDMQESVNMGHGPSKLADTLSDDDFCKEFVDSMYMNWIGHQAYLEWPAEMKRVMDEGGHSRKQQLSMGVQDPKGSASQVLFAFMINTVWDNKLSLRDAEQAMLKKCRSIPSKAQQFPATDYGLK